MSQLSFGIWGGAYTPATNVSYKLYRTQLGTINDANTRQFSQFEGPTQITVFRTGFSFSFVISSDAPKRTNCGVGRNISSTSDSNVYFTGISRNCTVASAAVTSTSSLYTNCFTVTETGSGSAEEFIFRFSPYVGVLPTIEKIGGASISNVNIDVHTATTGIYRRGTFQSFDSTFTQAYLTQNFGEQLFTIQNPDESITRFELTYNNGVVDIINPGRILGATLTFTRNVEGGYDRLVVTTTSGGYIYTINFPRGDLTPTQQFRPSLVLGTGSTSIGVGETLTIEQAYYTIVTNPIIETDQTLSRL